MAFWLPLLAAGAMQFGQTLLQNKANARQVKEENRARAQVDLKNIRAAAEEVGNLGILAGQLRTQAAQARTEIGRQVNQAQGTASAQAGALGIKGGSVDVVLADLERERAEALLDVERNTESQLFNLSGRLRALTSSTVAGLLGEKDPRAGQQNPLLQGALAAGQLYASNYFKFGTR